MEHADGQSHMEVTVKGEIEDTNQPAEYIEIEVNMNCYKEQLELEQVKEESPDNSVEDMGYKQRSEVPTTIESVSADPEMDFKSESQEYQPDILPKESYAIPDDVTDPTLCKRMNEESVEDKWRAFLSCMKTTSSSVLTYLETDTQEETPPGQQAQSLPYGCDKCPKTYKCKRTLNGHRKHEHATGAHKCTECNIKYKCKDYLAWHVRFMHSTQQHQCTVCRKMCKSKEALSKHVTSVHGSDSADSEPSIYTCSYCRKRFTTETSMLNHINCVHADGIYKCSHCDKTFQCEQYLTSHFACYNTAKITVTQVCNVCGKSLKLSNLKRHMRNMHSDKRLQCKLCGEFTRSKQYLHQHLRDLHGQQSAGSNPSIYTCSYCRKRFTTETSMLNHINCVHADGIYKCSNCDKTFQCEQYLTSHFARCNNAKITLTQVRNMHSDKRLQCKLCGEFMRSNLYLHKHLNDLHGQLSVGSHQQSVCSNFGKGLKSKWDCRQHEGNCNCTRPTSDPRPVASASRQQHNALIVKGEPADGEVELGPTVFQHMDCNYRPYKEEPQLDRQLKL